jgi:hypothetical protein
MSIPRNSRVSINTTVPHGAQHALKLMRSTTEARSAQAAALGVRHARIQRDFIALTLREWPPVKEMPALKPKDKTAALEYVGRTVALRAWPFARGTEKLRTALNRLKLGLDKSLLEACIVACESSDT